MAQITFMEIAFFRTNAVGRIAFPEVLLIKV